MDSFPVTHRIALNPASISENLARVRAGITEAASGADRDPDGITLIAVSKTKSAFDVAQALDAGQRHFGENYVQEAVTKISGVARLRPDASPIWHFIGAIQTNKTRELAVHFHWVHTVSREKVARRLNDQRPHGTPLNVCLQVKVDDDPNKSGVDPESVAALLRCCDGFDRLAVRGLMTILNPRTPPLEGYNRLRACFERLRPIAPPCWDTLSMGMSSDYAEAIRAGATMVRVGTAIFGARTPARRTDNEPNQGA